MKVLIIGGVAAGTKAAAKIKRLDRSAQVKILTKSTDISYAGCGLPYYVSGAIPSRSGLIVNTPESYAGLTGAQVITGCEVTGVDFPAKTVTAVCGETTLTESYDQLVIATGAVPFVPDVPGTHLAGVFCLRTPDDAEGLRAYITAKACRTAVVVGAGFIGLETAEALHSMGLSVTIMDAAGQIMPNAFDAEMAHFAQRKLEEAGMRVLTGKPLTAIAGTDCVSSVEAGGQCFDADVAVIAIGVRPATAFLAGSGLAMEKGAILVDEHMRTNIPDVFAAGDCALVHNCLTGQRQWSAMGSTANLSARVLAINAAGGNAVYAGCMGTGVVRLLPNWNAGRTGLTLAQAKAAGYNAVSALCVVDDKAHYYPDANAFIVKLIADRPTHTLLGLQVMGAGAVDKMVDIAVTGLSQRMKLEEFDTLDYAYAPPFSTAIHPFVQACYVLENKLCGELDSMTPDEYAAGCADGYRVLDVQKVASVPGADWVDLDRVDAPLPGIEKSSKLLLVCTRGKRAYMLQCRLRQLGYTHTKVLEGGVTFNQVQVARSGQCAASGSGC